MRAVTSNQAELVEIGRPPFILLKRPCLLVATFLIPGIVLGHSVLTRAFSLWLLLPALGLAAFALLLLALSSTFSTPVSMLAIFWVGLLLGAKSGILPPHHVHFALETGLLYEIEGVVVEEPVLLQQGRLLPRSGEAEMPLRSSLILRGLRARESQSGQPAWNTITGKILVYASGKKAARLQYGDKVTLTGTASLPSGRRNPGGFDYRNYLAQNDIYTSLRAYSIDAVLHGYGRPIAGFFHSIRRKIRHSFSTAEIDEEKESFLRAIILGERRRVGEEFREALRTTGTAHILAISGLHVGVLAGAAYFFLAHFLLLPRGVASLASLAALLLYAPLTGMHPPVLRASIMCTVFLVGPLLGKRPDSLNSLALAAVFILLLRPGDLFTAGFQLSFMVVLSILLLSNRIFRSFVSAFRLRPDPGFLTISPFRRWIYRLIEHPLELFSVSLAAFLGFLPLALYYFNFISFLAPLCNMLALPLIAFIVPLGFSGGVIGLLSTPLSHFITKVNAGFIAALQGIVTGSSSIGFTSLNVSPPLPVFIVAFYLVILLVGCARSLRRLAFPIVAAGLLAVGLFVAGELARRHPDAIEITFLDVGQGDCIFIEFPDGRKMLVDGGSVTRTNVGRRVIVPFLRWAGVNSLDAMVMSHFDADHINGLKGVLDHVRTREVFVRDGPEPPEGSSAFKLLRAVGKRDIEERAVGDGDSLALSPRVSAETLAPEARFSRSNISENERSIVLKVTLGEASILLCGDIEKEAEQRIRRHGEELQSCVVKVPHHGSNSSSSEEFIRQARPRIAVISCGLGNIYGHPSPQVLQRYGQFGVHVFRTDRDGGVIVRVFEDKLTVTTTL